jgi:hypothetical protein
MVYGGEEKAVKNCVEGALKAGLALDFAGLKQFCSADYVKIPENKKILDRKLLNLMSVYFEKLKEPDLTFSELVKLNFMLKGQKITEEQMANYRKLDSSERGRAMVQQAKGQLKKLQDNIKNIEKEVLPKVQYGTMYLKDDFAVWFYKLDYFVKFKGVLVLRKENGNWKIYREFTTIDSEKNTDIASEAEVRKFIEAIGEKSRNFASYMELISEYSPDWVAMMPPANGNIVNYQKSEKMAKFYDMIQNGNTTMVQAGPLYMEAFGIKVTPEMLAKFADQDKSGDGQKWIQQYRDVIKKHREELKKTFDNTIKHVVVFEDCVLVADSFVLPLTGETERISLLKKHQGKYLVYRSVSRKKE